MQIHEPRYTKPAESLEIVRAGKADVTAVSEVLARAFAKNPFVRWIVPDDAHYARIGAEFFKLGVLRELRDGEIYTAEGYPGAALWLPPDAGAGEGILDQLRMARGILKILGRRSFTGMSALARMEARRPKQPNWYLTILGTDPAQQGTGVGTKLLAPVLERCDRDGVDAYLESSDPANVTYYRRFGFEVTDEISFKGGPTLPLMTRRPRS